MAEANKFFCRKLWFLSRKLRLGEDELAEKQAPLQPVATQTATAPDTGKCHMCFGPTVANVRVINHLSCCAESFGKLTLSKALGLCAAQKDAARRAVLLWLPDSCHNVLIVNGNFLNHLPCKSLDKLSADIIHDSRHGEQSRRRLSYNETTAIPMEMEASQFAVGDMNNIGGWDAKVLKGYQDDARTGHLSPGPKYSRS